MRSHYTFQIGNKCRMHDTKCSDHFSLVVIDIFTDKNFEVRMCGLNIGVVGVRVVEDDVRSFVFEEEI